MYTNTWALQFFYVEWAELKTAFPKEVSWVDWVVINVSKTDYCAETLADSPMMEAVEKDAPLTDWVENIPVSIPTSSGILLSRFAIVLEEFPCVAWYWK